MALGGSLGGLWVLLGWFGGSGPGVGGFGGPSGSGWGPGAVVFLALMRTRSGIHDFQSSFILSAGVWDPKQAVMQGLAQSADV